MLYLYIGQVRNGKTVSAVTELKRFHDAGYIVYSNTWLSFPFVPLFRKDIIEWEKINLNLPPKCVMFIDEIDKWFDSRNSANSNNKVFSYFVSQLGKFSDNKSMGLTLLGTTQFFSNMDIRGRRLTYKIIECKKLEEKENEWIKVLRVWKLNDNLILKTVKREIVLFDSEDFNLYNTQQSITSVI